MQKGIIFDISILSKSFGFIQLLIKGKNAKRLFSSEKGGHQWHRVPPTEKRNRVHTSVITVSITDYIEYNNLDITLSDVKISTTRGSGAGGQHKNKVETCVILTYKDISVRCDSERSQQQNKKIAFDILYSKLNAIEKQKQNNRINSIKKNQHGNGNRAEKTKTYSEKRNEVVNHMTNERCKLSDWRKGKFN